MKLTQNSMQANYIAPESVFLLSVEDIISLNLLFFDGTKSLMGQKSLCSINPINLSKHPNAHTDEELKWIRDYHRRNPKISVCELYGKLRANKGYSRHPGSLYRIYRKLGYSSYAPSTKKKRKPQPYDTPTELGIKWQMVPNSLI